MPLFDLSCNNCTVKIYDRLLKSADEVVCPNCNHTMNRMVSKSNFELKGKCWEKDGYK